MKVLIVDDSVDFSSTIADIIKSAGINTDIINAPVEAINYMQNEYHNIDLILLDIEFGFGEKLNGLDLLDIFRKNYPVIPVVMITGKGTIEIAVRATKLGAVHFIEKNIITKARIKGLIDSILKKDTNDMNDNMMHYLEQNGIIGKSNAILKVEKNIISYANTDLNVLVTGKTGTGKKIVVNCLHNLSNRRTNKLVMVDISSITSDNYKEELFGSPYKNGAFKEADNGILFFNGLDELSLDIQLKLLTPIDESSNIRFISTASRDLPIMIKNGLFSEQLYYRLRECEIHIPSLDSRKEDIIHIVNHYTGQYNQEQKKNKYFSPSAIDFLTQQQWNGNVRELNSLIKLCLQTVRSDTLEVTDLIKIMKTYKSQVNFENIHALELSTEKTLKEDLAEVDKIKIINTLIKTTGNVSKAAALLGISRETLHNKIRRYNINTKEYRHKE